MAAAIRESVVEKHLVKRCKALGILVRKVRWLGVDGATDRVLMVPERVLAGVATRTTFWVELKRPGEKPRTRQVREHAAMRAHGQIVVTLDSVEAVDLFMEQFE